MIIPDDINLKEEEYINAICNLGVRLERLEDFIIKFFKTYKETTDFILKEAWKARIDLLKYNKKTPVRKLEELEASMKGMNTYYQERLAELSTPKRNNKYKYTL